MNRFDNKDKERQHQNQPPEFLNSPRIKHKHKSAAWHNSGFLCAIDDDIAIKSAPRRFVPAHSSCSTKTDPEEWLSTTKSYETTAQLQVSAHTPFGYTEPSCGSLFSKKHRGSQGPRGSVFLQTSHGAQ